ncbi:MAG: helix-turn-helix domain-containing protein [Gemmataceae bacterium]
MPLGGHLKPIALATDERSKLVAWSRRPSSAQRLTLCAKIVLARPEGEAKTTIAAELRIAMPTVGKWRQRFLDRRFDGLTDEPGPVAPRSITDERVEEIVTKTLESKPKNKTHWSTRGMAAVAGLSQTAISRIWQAFLLSKAKPHIQTNRDQPDLAGLWAQTPPPRDLQVLHRAVLHRKGPRCCGVVSQPSGRTSCE